MARKKKKIPDSAQREEPAASTPAGEGSRWRYVALGIVGVAIIAVALFALRRPSSSEPEDIILITIDTLRADSVGFAGNQNVKTPFLDRLASEGRVFRNAHAHNVVTLPSHVNILTGLYPYQHGVRENAGFTLDPKFPTIGSLLRSEGFATGGFVSAYPLDTRFGLNNGFDTYDDRYREATNPLDFTIQERPADETLTAARGWFESNESRRRFLFVHLYEPHAPYNPPPPFRDTYKSSPYLGEIAAVDDALQRFIGPMIDSGRHVLVIVTADHGESLGDHGEQTHGLFTYEATLKVPLVIWDSANKRRTVDERFVRHVDLVPSIMERVGVQTPANLPGRSLFREGEPGDTYFEALSASLNRGWAPLVGLIHNTKKYVDLPLPELYDLRQDPLERDNLVDRDRRSLFAIRKRLADAAPSRVVNNRNVSSEEQAKLLSLGYITGTTTKKSFTTDDDPKNLVELDTQLHQVVALYQMGKLAQALSTARDLVSKRSDMQVAREMLAFLLQQSERPEDAIKTLEEDVRAGRASDSMKIRLGLTLSESGRAKEAAQILAPYADRKDPSILNAYAIALADSGDLRGAQDVFQRVVAIDETNAKAYQGLGVVSLRAGQLDAANRYLLRAMALNDRMPLTLNTLGVIRAREGRTDEAIDLWKRAIEIDPRQYDAMFNLAILATRSGKREIAQQALKRFVETAPPERYGRDIEKARKLLSEIPTGP